MTLGPALLYFVREALTGLRRSLRVSLLAILTIAASLFMAGIFLLAVHQLRTLVQEWRQEARVIVYLAPDAAHEDLQSLAEEVRRRVQPLEVERVTSEEAKARFRSLFPSLAGLIGVGEAAELPASIEVEAPPRQAGDRAADEAAEYLSGLAEDSRVAMVDDDRDWLRRLELVILFVQGVGVVLGVVLLAAAVSTIAGVIRLTIYLYREEIAVMRLVGATEFYIRGPFYVAGLVQGVLGASLGTLGLWGLWHVVRSRIPPDLFGGMTQRGFLTPGQIALLLGVGTAAGLLGAILSVRRERPGKAG